VGIRKIKVMKETCTRESPPPAGDDGPRLNSRGLTWKPVMLTGMRARLATMNMRMKRKKHCKANDGSMQNVED